MLYVIIWDRHIYYIKGGWSPAVSVLCSVSHRPWLFLLNDLYSIKNILFRLFMFYIYIFHWIHYYAYVTMCLNKLISYLVGFSRFWSHPNPETRLGLLSQQFLSAYRSSVQQRKLWRLLFPTVNNHLLPSADQHGFSTSYSLCRCWPDGDIRYSQPQRIVIKDYKINIAGGDLSIAVKLH